MTPAGMAIATASSLGGASAPGAGARATHGAAAAGGPAANGTAAQQRQGPLPMAAASDSLLAELTDDLACPICMSVLRDPFVTSCGHSFCHACVSKHLVHRSNCPSCAAYLTVDGVFPNFLLQKARHCFRIE
jgi:E3 ubiquitin-protein ligase RFWD2